MGKNHTGYGGKTARWDILSLEYKIRYSVLSLLKDVTGRKRVPYILTSNKKSSPPNSLTDVHLPPNQQILLNANVEWHAFLKIYTKVANIPLHQSEPLIIGVMAISRA